MRCHLCGEASDWNEANATFLRQVYCREMPRPVALRTGLIVHVCAYCAEEDYPEILHQCEECGNLSLSKGACYYCQKLPTREN